MLTKTLLNVTEYYAVSSYCICACEGQSMKQDEKRNLNSLFLLSKLKESNNRYAMKKKKKSTCFYIPSFLVLIQGFYLFYFNPVLLVVELWKYCKHWRLDEMKPTQTLAL